MNHCTLVQARAAKGRAADAFGRLAHVAGVGVTRVGGGYGLKVNLVDAPADADALPNDVDGVPVRIEIVGRVRKR